ncbi:alkaline phosphatase [Bacillus sp. E(2018)]|uniref:alkaline phosphatase n=1 Tax=Bacillus sp. E(2018) TaxID=2502239 RepID=UPI0010F49B3A|nr:alkaline phosphatase [Bacillus sp. E(2018)]
MKKLRKIAVFAALSSTLYFPFTSKDIQTVNSQMAKPKNVIFMIADGYSTSYATNYRIYKGKESLMDPLLVGMVKTSSASSEITDSAAAASAYATGFKTSNGRISTSPTGENLKTIVEAIEEEGKKSTGLVATSNITHATPASFASHAPARADEVTLAPQLIENDVDVLFGGGRKYFDDSLIDLAKQKGYHYLTSKDELNNLGAQKKVLGLFTEDKMASELDRDLTEEPSLAEMSEKAINILNKNKKGFFLMIEGSQIDEAGHYHDAAWAMKDIEAFEEALSRVLKFAKKDQNTLVIVVGDHDTGGMSVGGYNKFGSNVEMLRNVIATGDYMESQLTEDRSNTSQVLKQYADIDLTESEITRIKSATDPSNEINSIISERSLVGWITYGHTGVDVPLYAYGPNIHSFKGLLDNTQLPKLISKQLDLDFLSHE